MRENLTRDEALDRSSHVSIDSYAIELDVRGEETFPVTSTITLTSSRPDTWLDFLGQSVESVTINGAEIPVEWDGSRIALTGLTGGTDTVSVRATGNFSRTGEGLHRFVDPADDKVYLYTQFEAAEARRMFPNMEQPNLKARYDVSVIAPSHWVVLANQPSSSSKTIDDSTSIHHFDTTPPLSTYLVAVVAGEYAGVRSEKDPRFAVWCRESLATHMDAEAIFDISISGLALMEEAFGYEYPWGKYDQVFVPEYNLGAMENPGCVTFTEAYVFQGAATRSQYAARANTILHEMSHMWFGDLVTPVWWDDLWLKESFAEFMGSWASVNATEFTGAWVAFTGARTAWAFQADSRPTTHPIIADIRDLEAADQNFDGITYAKGAATLRQLVAFVGEDAFFAGIREYFAKHEWSNTTLKDLLDELSASSGRDLSEWARQWLTTSGVSTLVWDDGVLTQIGSDPLTNEPITRPHRTTVGMYERSGDVLVRRDGLSVEISTTTEAPAQGDLILPNDEGLTYAKVKVDDASAAAIMGARILDPLARSVAWNALWQTVRDAALDPRRYIRGVLANTDEPDSSLLGSMLVNADFAVSHYVDGDQGELVLEMSEALGAAWREAVANGDDNRRVLLLRAIARVGKHHPETTGIVREAAETVRDDKDLRWPLLVALAATDSISAAELDAELGEKPAERDIVAHLEATYALSANRESGYNRLFTDGELSNDRYSAIISGINAPWQETVFPYSEVASQVWADNSQEIATRFLYGMFSPREGSVADLEQWLEGPGVEAPEALQKIMRNGLDSAVRAQMIRRAYPHTACDATATDK